MKNETYEQLRARQEKEMRDWVQGAMVGGLSLNAAARRANINAGTMWRLVKRFGQEVGDAHDVRGKC